MKYEAGVSGALAAEVARLIGERSLYERVIVESFALDAIAEIKRLDARIRTAALFEPRLSRPRPSMRKMIEQATDREADEMALHRMLATRSAVEEARRHGMQVVVWTVDSPSWIERAIKYDISALITNNPALMRAHRDKVLDV
jgi:glycerophosphoryl diester phosphodiesterase